MRLRKKYSERERGFHVVNKRILRCQNVSKVSVFTKQTIVHISVPSAFSFFQKCLDTRTTKRVHALVRGSHDTLLFICSRSNANEGERLKWRKEIRKKRKGFEMKGANPEILLVPAVFFS